MTLRCRRQTGVAMVDASVAHRRASGGNEMRPVLGKDVELAPGGATIRCMSPACWRAWFSRAGLVVVLGALLALGGCAPRDPLDRKVEAGTLAELQVWIQKTQRAVDPELAKEIDLVFLNLAAETPRFRKPSTEREMLQRGNPLCMRVHGRPLRDVMVDSYTAAINTLTLQNNIDAENLVRLSAVVNTERADAFERRLEAVRSEITKRDERIQRHRERIAQLRHVSK